MTMVRVDQGSSVDRKVPYSEDAEQAVLSAILLDNDALVKAMPVVTPEMFYREAHRRIFRAMMDLSTEGSIIDPLTLSTKLDSRGELEASGGKDYIGHVMDAVPTAANVAFHARIISEHAQRRRLIEMGSRLMENAYDGNEKAAVLAAGIQAELLPVATASTARGFVDTRKLATEAFAALERSMSGAEMGFSTGYELIDRHTGGDMPGDLVFLCGVPGSGKTAVALNMARRSSMTGCEVGFISAEMSRLALTNRFVALDVSLSPLYIRKVLSGKATFSQLEAMTYAEALGHFQRLPIHVDDTPTPRIDVIMAKCRALKAKHPKLGKIYLDFIQLIQASDPDGNRSLELTAISYALKGLAKELDVAVIATCQVDAAEVEKGSDKRPRLRHMRWSQGMREAGDLVGMVYLPSLYDALGDDVIEIDWEKARDLPRFKTEFRWVGQYMRMEEPAYTPSLGFEHGNR